MLSQTQNQCNFLIPRFIITHSWSWSCRLWVHLGEGLCVLICWEVVLYQCWPHPKEQISVWMRTSSHMLLSIVTVRQRPSSHESLVVSMWSGNEELCVYQMNFLCLLRLNWVFICSFSEKLLKYDHYLVPFTLFELAFLYKSQGEIDKAIKVLETARWVLKVTCPVEVWGITAVATAAVTLYSLKPAS